MNRWVAGARPRTLPASVIPVAVGTAVAAATGPAIWWRAATALVVSVAIQVGTNYANDYSDGKRGTDAVRVGPVRLVASGLATPEAVKRAALLAFAVAAGRRAGAGGGRRAGGCSRLAPPAWPPGWLYTGGPRPYGYAGLGRAVRVRLLRPGGDGRVGLRATGPHHRPGRPGRVPIGLLAVALLVVNNLRDIPGDTTAGKHTLAVRLGCPRHPDPVHRDHRRGLRHRGRGRPVPALGPPGPGCRALGGGAGPPGPVRARPVGAWSRSCRRPVGLQLVFGFLLAAGIAL